MNIFGAILTLFAGYLVRTSFHSLNNLADDEPGMMLLAAAIAVGAIGFWAVVQ